MIENSAGWRYIQSADSPADYPTVSAHNAGKFQELKTNVAGKAPLSHTHPQSQVIGLATALAAKAPLSHTHPQSQVIGLDAALAGKVPQTTLDARVPPGLALRLDTTVGTRILSGSTMIYGDTGWRDITPLLENGWVAEKVLLQRQNNTVILSTLGLSSENATSGGFISLPTNFHIPRTFISIVTPGGPRIAYWNASRGLTFQDYSNLVVNTYAAAHSTWQLEADRAWPATLPGTPA